MSALEPLPSEIELEDVVLWNELDLAELRAEVTKFVIEMRKKTSLLDENGRYDVVGSGLDERLLPKKSEPVPDWMLAAKPSTKTCRIGTPNCTCAGEIAQGTVHSTRAAEPAYTRQEASYAGRLLGKIIRED